MPRQCCELLEIIKHFQKIHIPNKLGNKPAASLRQHHQRSFPALLCGRCRRAITQTCRHARDPIFAMEQRMAHRASMLGACTRASTTAYSAEWRRPLPSPLQRLIPGAFSASTSARTALLRRADTAGAGQEWPRSKRGSAVAEWTSQARRKLRGLHPQGAPRRPEPPGAPRRPEPPLQGIRCRICGPRWTSSKRRSMACRNRSTRSLPASRAKTSGTPGMGVR